MSDGLATTFSVLSKTDNEAALRVLLPALDSHNQSIQEGALAALLERRHPGGQTEILRRIGSLSLHWQRIISRHPGRLTGSIRDGVLGKDESLRQNSYRAAVMFREYDLIPTLLTAMEDNSRAKADIAAETLLQLVMQLYDELAHPGEANTRRDPQWVRKFAVSCLETSVQRFGRHKRREVIEAFLLLVQLDNKVLNQILQNPHHVNFLVLIDLMSRSSQEGVIELLLSYLEDAEAPSAVLSVAASRSDPKFIREFLRKIGGEPSSVVVQNLKRIEAIAWLRNPGNILGQLDDAGQQSVVRLAMSSGIPQAQAYSVIEFILRHGKPGGRREAARALSAFSGAEANALALQALDDPDPQVQAIVLPQLRRRGIPGLMPRLVKKLDSPQVEVRQAARNALSEFSFARYMSTFEMLDDEARQSTGELVKKVDPQTIPLLCEELQSAVRSKRLRGMQIVRIMDVADRVEDLLINLLRNEERLVRAEAAATLAKCRSPASRAALEEALHDSSAAVREAAQRSLQEQTQPENVKLPTTPDKSE
jgi:HEAT repeat protein